MFSPNKLQKAEGFAVHVKSLVFSNYQVATNRYIMHRIDENNEKSTSHAKCMKRLCKLTF